MSSLILPADLVRELIHGFASIRLGNAPVVLHHILCVREGNFTTFTMRDATQQLTYLWAHRPPASTPLARRLDAIRAVEEACRLLVPLADLIETGKGDPHTPVGITADSVSYTRKGGTVTTRYATPDVEDFPPLASAFDHDRVNGWYQVPLQRPRADVSKLASAFVAAVA